MPYEFILKEAELPKEPIIEIWFPMITGEEVSRFGSMKCLIKLKTKKETREILCSLTMVRT